MNAGDILWIPKGFCHGFKTNSKDVLINYKLSQRFSKKSEYHSYKFGQNMPFPSFSTEKAQTYSL
jgi:dTDP-4-dehydrorhamnose 3,5-epimerase-like enzyme